MKWNKEQLIEGSLLLVRMKSQLTKIEHRWSVDSKRKATFHKRITFERLHSTLRKKIDKMEKEFLLNVANNGIEGEENAEPPSKIKK